MIPPIVATGTPMRLARFIEQNLPAIVESWEAFAGHQMPAAATMESLALRDHVQEILSAIVKDLDTQQSRSEQLAKSLGRAPVFSDAPETAAQTHAVLRAQSGFDINQLIAEYRALRASVLRQWTDHGEPQPEHLEDMIRFNEAVDQALAESVVFFSASVDRSRNLLLGMLGHDMRSPLQTIHLTAQLLSAMNAGAGISDAAGRLIRSGGRIQALLDDLLDFGRSQLGLGIRMTSEDLDAASLVDEEVARLRAAHPGRVIELATTGDCKGAWDSLRVQQLLCNLVENALKYGKPDAPVRVSVSADTHTLQIDVSNLGEPLQLSDIDLFAPLKRGLSLSSQVDDGLGLGLYIAREIARGHGGDVKALSRGGVTVFTVSLPKAKHVPEAQAQ